MSSKIHTPVALIPVKQAPLGIKQKMQWAQICFGHYGETKISCPSRLSTADFSIFQHVPYSLRRLNSPRNKTVMQWRFIIVDFLKTFLKTNFFFNPYRTNVETRVNS